MLEVCDCKIINTCVSLNMFHFILNMLSAIVSSYSIKFNQSNNQLYSALCIHRLRLQEERELKRQQDLDYEESLRNDREKV